VHPGRIRILEEHGFATIRDLLFFFPYRYEDRRHPTRIAELGQHLDEPVVVRGKVISANAKITPRKRMNIFEAAVEDGSGAVKLIWFNQPFLKDQIHRGDRISLYGVPKISRYGHLTIESPDWELSEGEEEGAIVPIYSKVGTIAPKTFRKIIATALDTALPRLDDPMPEWLRKELGVIGLREAIEGLHRPAELTPDFLRLRSRPHLRIVLQEFFSFQLALRVRRATEEVKTKSRTIRIDDDLREEVRRILPFRLTAAQRRVLKEIADDLQSERPMYRLLQGDVGSGKTIVALIAAMLVIRNGHQAALLAPTEILVEQHFARIRQILGEGGEGGRLSGVGSRRQLRADNRQPTTDNQSSEQRPTTNEQRTTSVIVAKATGSMSAGERRTLLSGLRTGYINLVVGTHALLEERVELHSLGLAIVDEQHRFGVEQRQALFAKGDTPDILVMTATPIPRSLALAIYGDLELSVIDELPPGRPEVKTAVRANGQLERVYDFIETEVAAGSQAYIVFPIIEESEKLNLKALTAGFSGIVERFPKRRLAMIHGRMSSADKDEVMQRFKRGEIDILVSTTVIEVGIDVPNASVMLILDADRFGLSQLHQLRGRIGRGTRKSYCILVSDKEKERLSMFAKTRSGFDLSELDLRLRGPGELLGTRQSGVPKFRFGNIVRDYDLMEKARDKAIEVLQRDGVVKAETLARQLLGAPVVEAVERD
jgi:ATP-dependent DNA helicase RecG